MIDRSSILSVRNKLAVFAVVSLAALAGWWSIHRVPLDAIPDLSDTQVIIYSRWNQSPDIVEDQVTYPIVSAMTRRAGGARGARNLRLRLLLRLRHLRRRHRSVLGAVAHARVPVTGAPAAARGRPDRARPRRHRSRLDLSVRPGGHDPATTASPISGPTRTGTSATTSRRCPASPRWRRWAAIRSSTRSTVDPNRLRGYGIGDPAGGRRGARRHRRGRRPAHGVRRHRVHGARPRLRRVGRGLRGDRRRPQRARLADPGQGPRRGRARAPTSVAASPSSTARARWSRASW